MNFKFNIVKDFLKYFYEIEEFHFLPNAIENWKDNKYEYFKEYFNNTLYHVKNIETTVSHNNVKETILNSINFSIPEYSLVKYFISNYLFANDIINNYLSQDIKIFDKKFPKGTKLSRFLIALVPDQNNAKNNFEVEYSMALQKLKISGKLVLSIHPMDFFTLSNNNNKWKTCFSIPYGDYSAGILSLLQDKITLVAYIHDPCSSPIWLQHHIWNNKVWRQLIHINLKEQWFIQNKAYPYTSTLNNNLVADFVKEVFNFNECNNCLTDNSIITELAKKHGYSKHYDDIKQTQNIVHLHYGGNYENFTPLIIGEESFCLYCGNSDTDAIICSECF